METVGHGGLWPGFRTEFLRVPAADLTVIVIANLATIDPWRLAHVIAADALEGDKRLKPKLEPITEAEIKPIAGTWFNAEEPSLFDLAWKNGEAVVTQNGMPFVLGRRPGDWFGSERGSFEFMLKPGQGRRAARCASISALAACSASRSSASARPYPPRSPAAMPPPIRARAGTSARKGENWQAAVSGPLIAGGPAWPVRGVDADTDRDRDAGRLDPGDPARPSGARPLGKVEAIEISTGRIKKMRFERQA